MVPITDPLRPIVTPVPPASPVEDATLWAFETANAVTLPEPVAEPTAGRFAALEPETAADPVATPRYPGAPVTVAEPEADPGCEISVVEDAETVAYPTAAAVEPASSHAVKPVGAV